MRRLLVPLFLFFVGFGRAHAFEPFTVQDIRVEGLQRVPTGTVFNYLPLRIGETVDSERAAEAIRTLYETGFFQDVSLSRDGDVLVVEVAERPAIASIELRGNERIPSDELLESLKSVGLAEGLTFNRFLLNDVEQELRRLYQSHGQYDTKVTSTVSPLERNRVGVRIDISESPPARIREIHIVGNEDFSTKELRKRFALGPKRWYQFFSSKDEYAREKLAADLESLTSFYLDRGYVNFAITSTQVTVSPERDGIYITVSISEGEQFKVGEVELVGDLVVGEETLRELIVSEPGELYSRERVSRSVSAIADRLGEEGYAFANINPVPEIEPDSNTVSLTYFVDPGSRVYVRRINIHGNERTQDEVIRRELRQMEGAWLSTAAVQRSRRRLERLGFFEQVQIETPRVPGSPNEVDMNISLSERLSGSFQIGAGYGDAQGVMFNLSIEQDNVLGTGDRLSLAFSNSEVNRIYSLRYSDRYFTNSGITQTLFATSRRTYAYEADLADYDTDSLSLGAAYSIPIAEDDAFQFGLSFDGFDITPGRHAPQDIVDWLDRYGNEFDSVRATVGWVRDTRNHAYFPTRGRRHQVGAEVTVPGSDLEFYKVSYTGKQYLPLFERSAVSLELGVAYGDGYGDFDELPFFERFYAGGISTVRGYRNNSLGERRSREEGDRALGGNMRIISSLEFMFPVADLDSVRLSAFIDGGNVFRRPGDAELGDLRFSAGIGFVWLSPLGAFTMSLATPLNDEKDDKLQTFQFTIGTGF